MPNIIHDAAETIGRMTFNRLNPAAVYIDGIDLAAVYTIDRAARTVTVNYYDLTGAEHIATIDASSSAYLDARHTAREFYRESGLKLPPRPDREPAPLPATDPRAQLAEFAANGRGWSIWCNGTERRIKLAFRSRPSAPILAAVKAAGFHYSPNAQHWLAKLTGKNIAAAQLLTMQLPA